ncbi:hypothetical protein Tco_0738073 [Tanacetum coccineum]
MPTEMELTLEQTQQGVSYEVSNIRVISFTMKMEIQLELISNKLMVEHAEYDEYNTYVLERFNTTAGNPIKEILLKLNLPNHKSILTDSKEYIKMDMERRSVKVKELRERCIITAFKLSNQEWYEHVGPKVTSSQDGKVYKMAKRDYAWLMISSCSRSHFSQTSQDKGTSSSLKSKITTTIHKLKIEVKDYELKTKVKA